MLSSIILKDKEVEIWNDAEIPSDNNNYSTLALSS